MANSDKNIVITPNIGDTDDPNMVFSGADASTTAQDITIYAYPENSGTLSFEGSAGQLLSLTNDFTGTIFSVNDISGIPSIEVDADGTISLAEFDGFVGIGQATPAVPLHVQTISATTNAAIPMLRVVSTSSGTPADGIGPRIEFGSETLVGTPGNIEVGGYLDLISTDVSTGTEDFDFVFSTMAAGAAPVERVRIGSSGLECDAFTSTGIDDNATGEVVAISDASVKFGDSGDGTTYGLTLSSQGGNSYLWLGSGGDWATGSALVLYSDTHSTAANDIMFRVNGTSELYHDNSASSWDFESNDVNIKTLTMPGQSTYADWKIEPGIDGDLEITADTSNVETVWIFNHGAGGVALVVEEELIADYVIYIEERAAAAADKAGYGQLWIKNESPNRLVFTDDIGYDFPVEVWWNKSISIESPVSGDDVSWFFTHRAIEVGEIRLVAVGSSPSSVVTIRHGTDRSATGTVIDTNTVTSTTTGHDIPWASISDKTIPADSFIWVEIGTTTGTVGSVHVTMIGWLD